MVAGDCPQLAPSPHACRACILSLLPLLSRVFTEVHVITQGVAPPVYQTFSPELQLLGWDGGARGGQLVPCPRGQ